jgi:hypothetical protein
MGMNLYGIDNLEGLSGVMSWCMIYVKTAESGGTVGRGFCGQLKCKVYNE